MMLRNTLVRATARVELAVAVLVLLGLGAATPRVAAADGGDCVDTCVAAFGVTFYNSAGDFFVLKDCATSLISGTTWCVYARLRA